MADDVVFSSIVFVSGSSGREVLGWPNLNGRIPDNRGTGAGQALPACASRCTCAVARRHAGSHGAVDAVMGPEMVRPGRAPNRHLFSVAGQRTGGLHDIDNLTIASRNRLSCTACQHRVSLL